MKFVYDTKNRLADFFNIFGTTSYKTSYVYGSAATQSPTLIYGIKLNDVQKLSYAYDSLARLTTKTINGANNYAVGYSYEDVSDSKTTTLLSSINNGGSTLSYTYDKLGNIETISENANLKATYHYDALSQLTREDNLWQDETIVYAYDVGGNIQSKTTYAYTDPAVEPANATDTINYTYGDNNWKDKLTTYNGQAITYDEIGNMLTFGTKTFTWEGRQLTALSDSGSGDSLTYQYNDGGIRTKKVFNSVTTNYYLNGSDVVRETNGTDTLDYFYDADGNLYGFKLNGTEYYYIRNGQNDITDILDTSGSEVVSYSYDTWGKLLRITGSLADTVGVKNPYRYRGYRYDTETGLYYLNSRYYDPEVGRFVNADTLDNTIENSDDLLSGNLFAYCTNNPVNHLDLEGTWKLPNWAKLAIGAVALTAAIVLTVGSGGALAPLLIGVAISTVSSAAIGGAVGYATGGKMGLKKGLIDGAADGFMWGGIGAAGSVVGKAIKGAKTAKALTAACFVAGTLVAAKDGYKPIEQIKTGDLVWSENPETGEKGLKRVVQNFIRQTDEFVHLKVDGQNITTTPEHPFYVPQKGWIKAIELNAGDKLVLQSGKIVIVEQVQHEILETPATVYNFEVEDFHTYYVSNSSILVHNSCSGGGFTKYSAQQLSKMVSGNFHGVSGAKNAILKDVSPSILKKVGKNPDIYVNSKGVIQLVSTVNKGVSIVTDLNIKWY
ncbi:polymorphic toxin-type HINT domain-containing protein [Acetanaerobacterium elongatum]|uniref:Intein C-terminal splicing region/intein N-terminal splicing region/RHS repeat-associated core domain-containing protein n=1 Tax=Acetanaerobacterium elongatum TaxID=258515 RepID=A0A1G9WQE1_9FIRM|nr:polymorphic toxin-type HINT domain-containing protein [Acetanaerobacterium elongatum]SDM86461.1 intein C-terminal splicing region/intein N-terminal splicing region/RHS repeat-associated core domain-containing protein [Acetanaerobacterium elongatum]